MLWGAGTAGRQDADRLKAFERLRSVPEYVLGFEEPDCPPGSGSAGVSVSQGVSKWEALVAPLKAKGAKVGSPSMCSESFWFECFSWDVLMVCFLIEQADETWLAEFAKRIRTSWDFTAIHINKNSLEGVKKDIVRFPVAHKYPWWLMGIVLLGAL